LTGLATADKRRARSERTREKLLDAAMACYRKNGIGGTAMEDVAQQAGVGRATLYRHFANQEALLADVMAHNLAQMQALMSTSIQDCTLPEEFFVETALVIINECYKRGLNTILFSDSTSNSVVSRISFSDPTLIYAIG
jgi:AcrR family transcriptional regulator